MAVTTIILPLVGDTEPTEMPAVMERRLREIAGIFDVDLNTIGGLIRIVCEDRCLRIEDVRSLLKDNGYQTGRPL